MHFLLFLAIACLPGTVLPSCSFPPEFWCTSEEIAATCDVSKQCAKWNKMMAEPPSTSGRKESLVRNGVNNDVVHLGSDDDDDVFDGDNTNFNNNHSKNSGKKRLLQLTILYEALCPDCQQFIIDQLAPTISELGPDFWSHVHLTLYPYGNAEETYDPKSDRWIFRCQHGPKECLGNLIATCVMNLSGNDGKKWFPFVHCMELRGRRVVGLGDSTDGLGGGGGRVRSNDQQHVDDLIDPREDGEQCAREAHLNWTSVSECVSDWRGNLVQHAVAKATPDHDYVPWIIFNGRHTEKMQDAAEKDLFKLVCRFMRHPKPFACYKRDSMKETGSRSYAKAPFRNT